MWWIFSTIYSLIYYSLLDFVIFFLVDVVAKTPLREAANDEEKKTIWLYESLVLTAASALVYLVDHVPWVLWLLTAVTLLYTQLYGRIDFRYWWNLLKTRWEEYQQHEESMEHMREQLSRQRQPVQPNTTVPYPHYYHQPQPGMGGHGVYPTPGVDHTPPHLVSQKQGLSQKEQPSWFWSRPGKWLSLKQPSPQPMPEPVAPRETPITSRYGQMMGRKLEDNMAPQTFDSKDLRRRPIREGTSLPKPIASLGGYSGNTIKTKFMSAFGLNNNVPMPPGLKNNGLNLCFMNSIVQSLSRSPHLITYLTVDAAKELECSVPESLLLTSFVELLHQCSLPIGSNDVSVLDPATFRQSVSALNSSLMAPLGQGQVQQDAAEFLMWLLESMHNILNKTRKTLQTDKAGSVSRGGRGEERFSSPTLAMLRFIYGDLNPRTIKELKDACRREIELANGLENESYAEPIQRLSDLEWLHHKHENESIVDDLFTGQLVEAYHCMTDNHISVNLQAFNILPVPIAAPREVSGVVYLEDCFTSFCHIEHLMGPDEMECTYCRPDAKSKRKTKKNVVNDIMSTPQTRSVTRTMSTDSALHCPTPPSAFMSPIVGQRDLINDSGFHDNIFRTSTPIAEACQGQGPQTPKQHIRDVQRRCLLRQLPECLAIQLMRFTYNQRTGRSKKIKAPVSIRLKDLNLTNIIYDTVTRREDLTAINASHSYDLYSVCVHLGAESTNHGHYVSYCLVEDKWFRFDDEKVMEVNMEYEITTKELRENAYILFYKRVTH